MDSSGNAVVVACGVAGGLLVFTLLLLSVNIVKRKHSVASFTFPEVVSSSRFMEYANNLLKSLDSKLEVNNREDPSGPGSACSISYQCDINCEESRTSVITFSLFPPPSNSSENSSEEDGRSTANENVQAFDGLQIPSGGSSRRSSLQQLSEEPYHLSLRPAEFDTETIAMSLKSDASDDENEECEVSSTDPLSMRPSLTVATGERKRQAVSAKGNKTVQKHDVLQKPSVAQHHLSGSQQLLEGPYHLSLRSAEFDTETIALSVKSDVSDNENDECEESSTDPPSMRPSLTVATGERKRQVVSAKGNESDQKYDVLQKPSVAEHHLSGSQQLLEGPYHLSLRSAEFDTETIALSVKSDVSDNENDECEESSTDPPSMRPSLTVATGERKRQVVSAKGNESDQKYDVLQKPSVAEHHLSGSQQLLEEPQYTSLRSAKFETGTKASSMESSLSEKARLERREWKIANYIQTCQEAMQMPSGELGRESSSVDSSPMRPSLMVATGERQGQVVSAKEYKTVQKQNVPQMPSEAPHHLSSSRQLLEEPHNTSVRPAELQTETIAMSMKSSLSEEARQERREKKMADYILACQEAMQMTSDELECESSSADSLSMRPSLMVATGERQGQVVSAKEYKAVQKQKVPQMPSEAPHHLSSSRQLLEEPHNTSVRPAELQTETIAMSKKSSLSEEARQERREKKRADYILTCQKAMQMTSVEPECEPSSTESSPMHPSLMAVTRERQMQVVSAKGEARSDKITVPK